MFKLTPGENNVQDQLVVHSELMNILRAKIMQICPYHIFQSLISVQCFQLIMPFRVVQIDSFSANFVGIHKGFCSHHNKNKVKAIKL